MKYIPLIPMLMLGIAATAQSATVLFQQPTATVSQADYSVYAAIDGDTGNSNGWAVNAIQSSHTAVFETVSNVGGASGNVITFTLIQNFDQHSIGRFAISVTNDDRSLFADGLESGGDVTANWTVLDPSSYTAFNSTLTKLGDRSILASGTAPFSDTYTITASTSMIGITGVRIETMLDPSIPGGGPGRASNSNYVLTEFQMDLTPVDLISLQQAFRVQDLTPKLTNVTLNGAHHRLLMDATPGKGGWHMWATGDYGKFNEISSDQSISELGVSKSLYDDTLRLGLGSGYTWSDQDAAFGGGSNIDGNFLVLEGNYRIPATKMIFSTLFYYGSFDAETSRGYLLGGAKSLGKTDIESLAMRLRLDWKDAFTLGKFSATPRISYAYIDTAADAFSETGGATPASFAKQSSKDHEARLGVDFDYELSQKTQLRTIVETVYRENDDGSLRGTAGAANFNLDNKNLNAAWGRLGFEVLHQLNDTTNVNTSVFGSTEGDDPTFSASLGLNVSF